MRYLLIPALLVAFPAAGTTQIPYDSFGDWNMMRTVPDELYDAAQIVAYTKLRGVDRPEYDFLVGIAQLGVSCPDEALTVFAVVPGVHQPANVRFWVDQRPAKSASDASDENRLRDCLEAPEHHRRVPRLAGSRDRRGFDVLQVHRRRPPEAPGSAGDRAGVGEQRRLR